MSEVDDTAPPAEAEPKGKHGHGGLLHGPHATEIMVVCGVATVVLGYLTFRSKSSSTTTAAPANGTGVDAGSGSVAGFDQASVQGLSDALATMQQGQAGSAQALQDALDKQSAADAAAQAGLAAQIKAQQSTIDKLLHPQVVPGPAPHRTPPPSPVHPAPAPLTYLIRSGDTLSQIAQRNHTTTAHLAQINGISNPNKIYAGHTIRLR